MKVIHLHNGSKTHVRMGNAKPYKGTSSEQRNRGTEEEDEKRVTEEEQRKTAERVANRGTNGKKGKREEEQGESRIKQLAIKLTVKCRTW